MSDTASYTSTTLVDELVTERAHRLLIQTAAEELLRLIDLPANQYITVSRMSMTGTVARLRDAIATAGGR